MNVEDIQFQKSKVLEGLLLSWGRALCVAVRTANNTDELIAIRPAVTEFTVLASAYSESTGEFQEDIGVSLGEAADLKHDALANATQSKEWAHYLADTEKHLRNLSGEA